MRESEYNPSEFTPENILCGPAKISGDTSQYPNNFTIWDMFRVQFEATRIFHENELEQRERERLN